MYRHLKPDIFSNPTSRDPNENKVLEKNSSFEADLVLRQTLTLMKRKIGELEAKIVGLNGQIVNLQSTMVKGLERTQGRQSRLEIVVKDVSQNLGEKISNLFGKLTEKRANDSKIQQMLDRHNLLVQKFELQMYQMQKVISEQDLKLSSFKNYFKADLKR